MFSIVLFVASNRQDNWLQVIAHGTKLHVPKTGILILCGSFTGENEAEAAQAVLKEQLPTATDQDTLIELATLHSAFNVVLVRRQGRQQFTSCIVRSVLMCYGHDSFILRGAYPTQTEAETALKQDERIVKPLSHIFTGEA